MLFRLALLFAIVFVLVPDVALARVRRQKLPADTPTLFVSKDVMAIRTGQQKVTASLTDGSLSLETPQGNKRFTIHIASADGWVHPTGVIAAPKTYRARDLVTAVVTLAVPDDRKLVLRISAYPGVAAVFVKSGVTGQYGGRPDYYFWAWDGAVESYFVPGKTGPEKHIPPTGISRFGPEAWVFYPGGSGGVAVLTNGVVGYQANQSFINALPRSRFLRPGETLDVAFGLAGVASAADAAALAKTARSKAASILKPIYLTKQAKINYGIPAPDWLRNADMYNGWRGGLTDDLIGSRMKDLPVVVGLPADKEMIAKAHEQGLRAVVYVNYSELQNSAIQMQAKGKLYQNADEATPADLLDLAKYPEWTCIDLDGSERRSIRGIAEDIPGLFATCFHQADLRHNALTQVLNIMNLGADGIFLDNAAPPFECYAPKFGKHRHDDPYQTNTAAAEELQKTIYKLVKTYGEDKVVIHNSGILPSHWAYADAQMWEVRFDEKTPELAYDWPEYQYAAEEHADAIRHGKVAMIVPHFGDAPDEKRREGALYAYAYSRIYGFTMADFFDLAKTPELASSIYSIRLGKSPSGVQESGGVLYRVFENGVVALNPTPSAASVNIPVPPDSSFTDVSRDRKLTASAGVIRLEMSPESGRVLLRAE